MVDSIGIFDSGAYDAGWDGVQERFTNVSESLCRVQMIGAASESWYPWRLADLFSAAIDPDLRQECGKMYWDYVLVAGLS